MNNDAMWWWWLTCLGQTSGSDEPSLAELAAPFEQNHKMHTNYVQSCRDELTHRGIDLSRIIDEKRYQYCIANRGGDKLGHKGTYTQFYEKHLAHMRYNPNLKFLEIGVWQGWSLAVWSLYFPFATHIVGADVYLSPWYANKRVLKSLGAFPNANVRVLEMDSTNQTSVDQTIPMYEYFDIVIDDGCHHTPCILNTARNMWPLLKRGGLLFVEDNWKSKVKIALLTNYTYVDGYTHDGAGGVYMLRKP
jgi:hypothetical protein